MSGAHRGAGGGPANAAKSARRLLALFSMALLALAVLGLISSIFVAGTTLDLWCALWLVWLAVFVARLAPRRRDAFWLRISAMYLVTAGWQVIAQVARNRGWPAAQQRLISDVGDAIYWAAGALLTVILVLAIRSGTISWPRRSRASP